MKKYILKGDEILEEEDSVLYIGTAREIASLWNNFNKHFIAEPSHCDRPQFNMLKMYGLSVAYEDSRRCKVMYVTTADTALTLLMDGGVL